MPDAIAASVRQRRRQTLALALLALTGCTASDHYHRRFDDAERWTRVFDDPARDAWQQPDQVIAALELAPDARVVDLGAGTGYFSMRLARAVPRGRVFGVDVEADMVRHLRRRAEQAGLTNFTAVQGQPEDPRIAEPVDLILIVDTYHHIGGRIDYFKRLTGRLAPGGRVAVIDFTPDSPEGPPRRHRIAPEAVIAEFDAAGYRPAARHTFLPRQYFLIFEPRPVGQ